MSKLFASIITFLWLLGDTNQLRILQVVPGVTNSLRMFNYRLAGALTKHGHNVTALLVKFYPLEEVVLPPDGVELVEFYGLKNQSRTEENSQTTNDFVYKSPSLITSMKIGRQFNEMNYEACENMLASEEIQLLLATRKFDFAMSHIYAICPVAVLADAGIPTGFTCAGMYILDTFASLMGIPFPSSYVPSVLTFNSDLMSLWERLWNLFYQELVVGFLQSGQDSFGMEDSIIRQPPYNDKPHSFDTVADIPVLFLNGEQMLDFPRPMTLNVQYTGNMERRVKKSLSQVSRC